MENFFQYGETEIAYLKQADKRLAEVIDRIGKVERRVIPDLFAALVHSIVGQQISTKAHETIWRRIENALGKVTPEAIDRLPMEELQGFGITFKKAAYIRNATRKVMDGTFDIQALYTMSDDEVCARLSELDGIGVWSAEMLMLFSMQRPDILSFGDLAIQRGLRMVNGDCAWCITIGKSPVNCSRNTGTVSPLTTVSPASICGLWQAVPLKE